MSFIDCTPTVKDVTLGAQQPLRIYIISRQKYFKKIKYQNFSGKNFDILVYFEGMNAKEQLE